jgi:hypothetical protein
MSESAPRIRLRTVFLLFVCAAVGLSIGTSPQSNDDPFFSMLGWHEAKLNWHYALLSAGSVMIVVMLLNQLAQLRMWKPPKDIENETAAFSRSFSIGWRVAVLCLLTTCLIAAVLVARQVVKLPESETFFSYELFPYAVWIACLIVVLSANLARWRSVIPLRPEPWWRTPALWVAGVAMAALLLPDSGFILYLVHIATEGIEHAQPPRFQTIGAFPDQRAEGFRLFWISAAVATIVFLAAASLVFLNACRFERRVWFASGIAAFAIGLTIATGYCVWYYGYEFQRVSPYLAAVEIGSSKLEWFAGMVLAAIGIVAGAHRLSASNQLRYTVQDARKKADGLSVYEPIVCLLLFVGATVLYLEEVIRISLMMPSLFTSPYGLAETIVGLLQDPGAILMIAILVLSLQLCRARWRHRSEPIAWTISAVNRRDFLWSCVALTLLTVVGIPTISAFVFTFWLGPWYLYGP